MNPEVHANRAGEKRHATTVQLTTALCNGISRPAPNIDAVVGQLLAIMACAPIGSD